jgi:hypothetical protein
MFMVLQLAPEEPEGDPWRAEPVAVIVEALVQLGQGRAASGRGVVLAVAGRSSSGKTTLAARLQNTVRGSAVVHTDDIACWYSRFGWADLLINGVLVPFHRGEPVNFRPPGWAGHGREGSIEVAARCPLLAVEREWEPRWSHGDERLPESLNVPGWPIRTRPRSRTDLNTTGRPDRNLPIRRSASSSLL